MKIKEVTFSEDPIEKLYFINSWPIKLHEYKIKAISKSKLPKTIIAFTE